MREAVVLLSGGLDSAVTLYYALSRGYRCLCLNFDYGQRHRRELENCRRIAERAGCKLTVLKLSFPWKGSSLLDKRLSLPGRGRGIPSTYVPARNLVFLSLAVSMAEAEKCASVFIGAHSQDYSGYPDCRPEFFRAFRLAAEKGTRAGMSGKAVGIEAPLLSMGKAGIIRLGRKLGAPLELTWSCYRGGARPCGECDSCRYRAKGFREAGWEDPALRKK